MLTTYKLASSASALPTVTMSSGFDTITGAIEDAVKSTTSGIWAVRLTSLPLLATVLEFVIFTGGDIEEVLEALRYQDMVLRAWHQVGKIYAFMGSGTWQATRRDRFRSSPVRSVTNALPLSSDQRPQIVCLSTIESLSPIRPYDMLRLLVPNVQLMVWFLRASLRLSAQDVNAILRAIPWTAAWSLWPYSMRDSTELRTSFANARGHNEKPLGTLGLKAFETLIHPCSNGYGKDLVAAMDDMQLLKKLHDRFNVSAAERDLDNKFLVVAVRTDRKLKEATCLQHPSFFIGSLSSDESASVSHIHLLDVPVARFQSALILNFVKRPTKADVYSVLDRVAQHLGLSHRWLYTPGMPYTRAEGGLFRPDGATTLSYGFMLTRHVREHLKPLTLDMQPMASALATRWGKQNCHILIWLRQSSPVSMTSVAMQLCGILDQTCAGFELSESSKITVAIEYCSSNLYPLANRRLVQEVLFPPTPAAKFTHLLTVNPDRLTRRPSEVGPLINQLDKIGCTWWSRGYNAPNVFETEWYCVGAGSTAWPDYEVRREDLEAQLQRGHRSALQSGVYNAAISTMIRVLDLDACLVVNGSPSDIRTSKDYRDLRGKDDIFALQQLLRYFCHSQNVKHVVLYARTSPARVEISNEEPQSSIERQVALLTLATAAVSVPTSIIREHSVSAYCGESLRSLQGHVGRLGSRSLILSTSIERLIRQPFQLSEIDIMMAAHGHMVMSLIWDEQTVVDPVTALGFDLSSGHLAPAVERWRQVTNTQRRETGGPSLPLVQPLLWSPPRPEPTILAHVLRHLTNSAAFVGGQSSTRFRGGSVSVPEQLNTSDGQRGFSSDRETIWKSWLSNALNLHPAQLTFTWLNAKESHTCSCSDTLPHSPTCTCPCATCAAARRTCPCKKGSCTCSALCNCRCKHCHSVSGVPLVVF